MNPWSVFWQQGHSTTFGNYQSEGYDGAVGDWWRKVLTEDASPTSTIIEIGCGNCSLLPAIVEMGKAAKYIGVDIARVKISPVAQKAMTSATINVVLHDETPAEEIPEQDASVDLASSVFGVEYSVLDKSFPEIHRLLRPGGKFRALLHHHESVVTGMTRKALSEFQWPRIEDTIGALETINNALDRIGSKSGLKHDADAESARVLINLNADKYLSDTNPQTANAIMFEFMTSTLKFFHLLDRSDAERKGFIVALSEEYEAYQARLEQMASVTMNDAGIEAFKRQLQAAGFKGTVVDVLKSGENTLAWQVCTEK